MLETNNPTKLLVSFIDTIPTWSSPYHHLRNNKVWRRKTKFKDSLHKIEHTSSQKPIINSNEVVNVVCERSTIFDIYIHISK